MNGFLERYAKKVLLGVTFGIIGFFTIGMSKKPELDIKAAPLSTEVCCDYSESVRMCVTNAQITLNFNSLTDESIERIESLIPDEAKYLASQELGSASRREYIQWFYNHGYIPAELLGIAVNN